MLIHPKSRAKLRQAWDSVSSVACQIRGPLFEGVLELMKQMAMAESIATRTLHQVQAALPPAKKGTAIVYLRRVFVLSKHSLAVDEIVRRMRNDGYVSRGQRPDLYVRRLMRNNDQFVEDSAGLWALQG